MKYLIICNILREGPGLIGDILNRNSIEYDIFDFQNNYKIPSNENYDALIVLGGPDSANDNTPKIIEELQIIKEYVDAGIPYFGICLGLQLLVKAFGGIVKKNLIKEVGWRDPLGNFFNVNLTFDGKKDPMFRNVKPSFKIFQLHGETVDSNPEIRILGTGKYCDNQIIKYKDKAYGVQGHIELNEQMILKWVEEDEDLKKLDNESMIEDYYNIKREYEYIGKKIFNNFIILTKSVL